VDEVVAYTIGQGAQKQTFYPHYNHLYSVAALTDAMGNVTERYTYDAYGKQTITAPVGGVVRAKSAVGWDRGFTGYITDNETGLMYARRRMYSSRLGLFVGRDPLLYIMGSNLYRSYFVPGWVDPFGTFNVSVSVEAKFSTHKVGEGGITDYKEASAQISADCISKPCTDRWMKGCVKPCYNNGVIKITVPISLKAGLNTSRFQFNCRTLRPARRGDDQGDLVTADNFFVRDHELEHANQFRGYVEEEAKKITEKCGDCQMPPVYPWAMTACSRRFKGELESAFANGKLNAMAAAERTNRASGTEEGYFGDPAEEGANRAACQAAGFVP